MSIIRFNRVKNIDLVIGGFSEVFSKCFQSVAVQNTLSLANAFAIPYFSL